MIDKRAHFLYNSIQLRKTKLIHTLIGCTEGCAANQ